jgi:hypothetical protein
VSLASAAWQQFRVCAVQLYIVLALYFVFCLKNSSYNFHLVSLWQLYIYKTANCNLFSSSLAFTPKFLYHQSMFYILHANIMVPVYMSCRTFILYCVCAWAGVCGLVLNQQIRGKAPGTRLPPLASALVKPRFHTQPVTNQQPLLPHLLGVHRVAWGFQSRFPLN